MCGSKPTLSHARPGSFFVQGCLDLFYTNAPAGGNTGGGVWLCIGAQEVGGSDVQDVTECKEIICFGLAYASLIIADRADGDIKLLRQFLLRQPGGLPCLPDDAGRFGMGTGGHK